MADVDTPLIRLASAVGRGSSDLADEHDRLAVYRAATARAELHTDLLTALRLEPRAYVASDVAAAMLELDTAHSAEAWITAVAAGTEPRAWVERRAREIVVLPGLRSGGPTHLAVDEWSDWLQRRAADEADDAVLVALAADGRTRRIRDAAAQGTGARRGSNHDRLPGAARRRRRRKRPRDLRDGIARPPAPSPAGPRAAVAGTARVSPERRVAITGVRDEPRSVEALDLLTSLVRVLGHDAVTVHPLLEGEIEVTADGG